MIGNIPEPVELYAEVSWLISSYSTSCPMVFQGNSSRRTRSRWHWQGHQCLPLLKGFIADTRRAFQICGEACKLMFRCTVYSTTFWCGAKGEKFTETKKRLQARIGVSDKELVKYKFALIQVSTFKQPSYIEDGAWIWILLGWFLTKYFRRFNLRSSIRTRRRPRYWPYRQVRKRANRCWWKGDRHQRMSGAVLSDRELSGCIF